MKKEKPIALIAGAGSRLGKSLINEFVERGYKVVAASRSEVSYSGAGDVSWKKLDITNHSDCKNVVESTISEHNGVDALVICSGYYPSVESFFDQSHEDIMLDIGITFRGPVSISKFFIDANKKHEKGDIVFLSSCGRHLNVLDANLLGYSANKAAINRFSENLNEAIKPYGMRSFTVIPWQLSEETDINSLISQNAISYNTLSEVIADILEYKGNAQVSTIEVKPNFRRKDNRV